MSVERAMFLRIRNQIAQNDRLWPFLLQMTSNPYYGEAPGTCTSEFNADIPVDSLSRTTSRTR